MFLLLSNFSNRVGGVPGCGFDLQLRGGGWPVGKVLLIEGGEELAKRLGVVVLPIELELQREPRLLVSGTC